MLYRKQLQGQGVRGRKGSNEARPLPQVLPQLQRVPLQPRRLHLPQCTRLRGFTFNVLIQFHICIA